VCGFCLNLSYATLTVKRRLQFALFFNADLAISETVLQSLDGCRRGQASANIMVNPVHQKLAVGCNHQVKLREGSNAVLHGATEQGLPWRSSVGARKTRGSQRGKDN